MKNPLTRMNTQSALFFSLGAVVSIGLVLLGRAYELTRSDWSGWVQAVGSIGAIAVGFSASAHQAKSAARLARRERLEADDHRLTAALSISMFAADLVDNVMLQVDHRGSVTGYLDESSYYLDFDGAARVLATIPLHELRSQGMVSGVLRLQRCVAQLSQMTAAGRADSSFEQSDYLEWRESVVGVRDEKNIAMDEIANEVEHSRNLLRDN